MVPARTRAPVLHLPCPATKHDDSVGQAAAESLPTPTGNVWATQLVPPSVVATIAPLEPSSPTTKQVVESAQLASSRTSLPIAAGTVCSVHRALQVEPPFVVLTAIGQESVPLLSSPTAMQFVAVGQAS